MQAFPKIKQPEGSILCGAYCVVAALHALGETPLKKEIELQKLDILNNSFTGDTVILAPTDDLDCLSKKVYKITGLIPEDNYSSFDSKPGLNSIAGMTYVLEQFGLTVEVIVESEIKLGELAIVYPQELKLMSALKVPVSTSMEKLDISINEVLIPTIEIEPNVYHCVAVNSSSMWFDPATGDNNLRYPMLKDWYKQPAHLKCGTWLGVALKVSKNT